jgi:hypothetical protein
MSRVGSFKDLIVYQKAYKLAMDIFDISSFGNTVQDAIDNLNEALELYFEDKEALFTITPIQETLEP